MRRGSDPGSMVDALALHADQILVQIAAERTPNRIVVVDAGPAFFSGVAL